MMFSSLCLLSLAAVLPKDLPGAPLAAESPHSLTQDESNERTREVKGAQTLSGNEPHRTTKAHAARAPLRPTSSHASAAERPAGHAAPATQSSVALAAAPAEGERDWGMGAELLMASRFLWRGQLYGQGPVLQPSVWASYCGFEMSFWGNVQVMPRKEQGLSIFAPAVSYTYAFDWGNLSTGGALYLETLTQEQPPTAGEFYVNASLEYKIVSLHATQYLHYLGKPGAYYAEAGPAIAWDNDQWSIGANLDVAWASPKYNGFYFGRALGGFNLLTLRSSLAHTIGSTAYVQVQGEINRLLRDSLHIRKSAWVASGSLSIGLDF